MREIGRYVTTLAQPYRSTICVTIRSCTTFAVLCITELRDTVVVAPRSSDMGWAVRDAGGAIWL